MPMSGASTPITPVRDYLPLLDRLTPAPSADAAATMQRVADALWEAFSGDSRGSVSWVGFYTWNAARPDELVLAARRNKPACSPIALHGACGQCFIAKRPMIVPDVKTLGANYVACNPRDQAEVIVPLLNPDGTCWGVLDGDSFDVGAFNVADALALAHLLRHVGLSSGVFTSPADVIVR